MFTSEFAWDQVVLLHYYRQKILLFTKYTKQMYLVNKKPGSDLLSHGESPHYHRHYNISLLSSAWDQVVLLHYYRQKILYLLNTLNKCI